MFEVPFVVGSSTRDAYSHTMSRRRSPNRDAKPFARDVICLWSFNRYRVDTFDPLRLRNDLAARMTWIYTVLLRTKTHASMIVHAHDDPTLDAPLSIIGNSQNLPTRGSDLVVFREFFTLSLTISLYHSRQQYTPSNTIHHISLLANTFSNNQSLLKRLTIHLYRIYSFQPHYKLYRSKIAIHRQRTLQKLFFIKILNFAIFIDLIHQKQTLAERKTSSNSLISNTLSTLSIKTRHSPATYSWKTHLYRNP